MRLACWWEDRKHGCFELRSVECGHLDSKFYWRRKNWRWEWEAFLPGNSRAHLPWASFFSRQKEIVWWGKSLMSFSKLLFRKRLVFSTHSCIWKDIRKYVTGGGKMCPPAVGQIGLWHQSFKVPINVQIFLCEQSKCWSSPVVNSPELQWMSFVPRCVQFESLPGDNTCLPDLLSAFQLQVLQQMM